MIISMSFSFRSKIEKEKKNSSLSFIRKSFAHFSTIDLDESGSLNQWFDQSDRWKIIESVRLICFETSIFIDEHVQFSMAFNVTLNSFPTQSSSMKYWSIGSGTFFYSDERKCFLEIARLDEEAFNGWRKRKERNGFIRKKKLTNK